MALKNTHEDTMRNYQPQQKNLFELHVNDMGDAFNSDGILMLSLVSVSLPGETTEVTVVEYLNTEMYFAGKTTIGELSASFRDYCDKDTLQQLLKWRRKVWNSKTHRAGLAADYKKNAQLTIYAPDALLTLPQGDPSPATVLKPRVWDLYGLWPTSCEPDGMDMTDSGQMMVSMGLRCDKAIPATEWFE